MLHFNFSFIAIIVITPIVRMSILVTCRAETWVLGNWNGTNNSISTVDTDCFSLIGESDMFNCSAAQTRRFYQLAVREGG